MDQDLFRLNLPLLICVFAGGDKALFSGDLDDSARRLLDSGLTDAVISNTPGLAEIDKTGSEERKKREGADQLLQQASDAALETTLQALEQATQEAERALDRLEEKVASIRSKIDAYDRQIEENAIELKDGTKVYFNKETKLFEKKSAEGKWVQLTEDEQKEAMESAKKKEGGFSSKQDREKLDKAKTDVNAAVVFLNDKRDQVGKEVDGDDIEAAQTAVKNRESIAVEADRIAESLDIVKPPEMVDKQEIPAVVEREASGADLFNSLSANAEQTKAASSPAAQDTTLDNTGQTAAKLQF